MNFSEPADVRLVIEGSDPLPAHEVVLRLASPVLRDALVIAEPGADGVKELPLPGDDPAQWKLVRWAGGECEGGVCEHWALGQQWRLAKWVFGRKRWRRRHQMLFPLSCPPPRPGHKRCWT
jgi:hypothetical protein